MITGSEFLAFIEKRQPHTAREIIGSSHTELDELQHSAPMTLPQNYVAFLRFMGSAHGGFRVFPEHDYLIQDLLNRPNEGEDWDRQRYFLIGFQDPRQSREDPHSLFLDLKRSDGIDAPIVGFQPGPSPTVMSIEHGIADFLIFRIAWLFAMDDKPARARLISFCDSSPDGHPARDRHREIKHTVERLGFAPCLPATPYSWFGQRDDET